MEHKIQIVSDKARNGQIFDSYEAAEAAGFKLNGERVGGQQLRDELVGKPVFANLCGPMWGGYRDAAGEGIYFTNSRDNPASEIANYSPSKGPVDHYLVRYEDWESYELLSR